MASGKNSKATAENLGDNTVQKHSTPFYVSSSLFQNKRLKQKRVKWACLAQKPQVGLKANFEPDITIDLLSDNEENVNSQPQNIRAKVRPYQSFSQNSHEQKQLGMYVEPSVSLFPIPPALSQPATKRFKRKRKARPMKRHAQPTIVNSESIVLSDSDTEGPLDGNQCSLSQNLSTNQSLYLPQTAQLDEEVTVSLVPRSSASGSCSKLPVTEMFPMQPDETTVHTVIANRIYELSLTKLREGLDQEPVPTTRRKMKVNAPVAPPPPVVSLKLSSDLSISLISDDEDEHSEIQTEQLLEQQNHLSVTTATDSRQVPRRRKLG